VQELKKHALTMESEVADPKALVRMRWKQISRQWLHMMEVRFTIRLDEEEKAKEKCISRDANRIAIKPPGEHAQACRRCDVQQTFSRFPSHMTV